MPSRAAHLVPEEPGLLAVVGTMALPPAADRVGAWRLARQRRERRRGLRRWWTIPGARKRLHLLEGIGRHLVRPRQQARNHRGIARRSRQSDGGARRGHGSGYSATRGPALVRVRTKFRHGS